MILFWSVLGLVVVLTIGIAVAGWSLWQGVAEYDKAD